MANKIDPERLLDAATIQWLQTLAAQGILTTDADLNIRGWNRWLELHSGRSAEDMIGRHLLEAYPDLLERRLDQPYREALDGQTRLLSHRFHGYLLPMKPDVDGSAFIHMQQSAQIAPLVQGERVIGTITVIDDVTERVTREVELQDQITALEAMHDIGRAVLSLDMEECLQRVVQRTSALLGNPLTAVVLQENGILTVPAYAYFEPLQAELQIDAPGNVAELVVQSGSPLWIADIETETDVIPLHASSRSIVASPLLVDERVIGAMVVESSRPHAFSQNDQTQIARLTTQAAIAIQHARLYSLLAGNRQWLSTMLTSIGDAVIATDVQGQVTFINPVAQALTGWTQAEAPGQPLTEVFKIINKETRQAVDNPVTKVLQAGMTVGIANHTVLISKDGTERPIDDSGAPIKDATGQVIGAVLIFRDISERQRVETERALLAAIVESSEDAIVGKTLESIITSWNKGAERLFGYTAEEIIGQSLTRLIPPDRQEEEPQIIEQLKRGERVEHFESVRIRKDGQPIDVALTISPIKNTAGEVVGASKIARDISERKRLEKEREQLLASAQTARAQAEAANRMKDEFLATVSHELRTPLNAILGWSSLMQTRKLDAHSIAHAFETIERNARAQNKLIEDLLDVSRIITGKMRLELRVVDLLSVVEAALDAVRPTAEAKGVRLQSTLDSLVGPVEGDPNRLQQIVWNLLSNAIKFTPKGGRVLIQLKSVNAQAEITVTDTGIGINQEFLPYIFDRFRQADSATTRMHGGLGLGLAIVRHLTELHGGTVSAHSLGEGQGATFTVQLPITAGYRKASAAPQSPPVAEGDWTLDFRPSLEGVRVLVVDDDSDARALITAILEQCGASVRSATSTTEALAAIEREKPDVLVSDIQMPVEDGYTLMRKVRVMERERGGHLPAAALTAYARTEDRMRALMEGYQIHLPKPVEPNELVAVVATLANRIGKSTPL